MKRDSSRAPGRNRLAELLGRLAVDDNRSPSGLPGLYFFRIDRAIPRHPVSYDPSIVIVAQGRKIGYLGDETFVYDADNYLLLTVPLPFECEVIAEPSAPYLALSVRIDAAVLAELLASAGGPGRPPELLSRCFSATPLTEDLEDAAVRLLRCLDDPVDARVLGPEIMREMIFRVLRGPKGHLLQALAARNGRFFQVARALDRIHADFSSELDVDALADEAGMSVSAFHHAFKTVTATSPLQYLKSTRLLHARLLMIQDGLNVGQAADRVGYESVSQFSREFKRFFGNSPSVEASRPLR